MEARLARLHCQQPQRLSHSPSFRPSTAKYQLESKHRAMSWLVKTRAFGVGGNLQHLLDDNDPEAKVNTTLGGRVDVARLFDDIKVVGSITVRSALPLSSRLVFRAGPLW